MSDPCTHSVSLSTVALMCIFMWERGYGCIMTCHGICLGQVLLRCQRKKRMEERQNQIEEGRDDGWDISCNVLKKGIPFSFLSPSHLWSNNPLQCTVDQLHCERIPPHTLCYLLRLFASLGIENGMESGKEGWSSHSGRRKMEGNPPVTFLITLKSPDWVMRLTGLHLVLRGFSWMFFVCVCVQ